MYKGSLQFTAYFSLPYEEFLTEEKQHEFLRVTNHDCIADINKHKNEKILSSRFLSQCLRSKVFMG